MTKIARVLVAGLGCCVSLISGCSPFPPPILQMRAAPEGDTFYPIQCNALDPSASPADTITLVDTVTSAGDVVELFVADNSVAKLIVPEGAVAVGEQIQFTFRAPALTPYAYVIIDAEALGGGPVSFQQDVTLALRVEGRNCSPLEATNDSSEIYLYDISGYSPEDTMVVTAERTDISRGGEYGKGLFHTSRAAGFLDDFSGFIIAQGRSERFSP